MNGLLDTHSLIWWVLGDPQLSQPDHQFIADPANVIFVSAASAWEIATAYRLGRLPNATQLVTQFPQVIVGQGFIPLRITATHGILAGSFPGPHRDPFDRMLAAQAITEKMPLVSRDPHIPQFGVTLIW